MTDIAESLFGAYARGMDFSDFDRYECSGRLWARLAKFSPVTLDRIEATRPNGKRVLASVILGHHTEKTVNDFLAVIGVMESEGMTERDVNAYLTSLTKYAGLVPQERGGSYPEERGEQCRALVRVMRHMEHVSEQPPHGFMRREGLAMKYPFIEDDELLGLLLYPDVDRESVIRVIMERDLYNVEAIREIVRNVHPSLLDGGL